MHQNIGEVMIPNVSVRGEIGKWGQMHFMSCFFSKDIIPLVFTADDFTVNQWIQFPSILLFTLNPDLIFQTYHMAPELSLGFFYSCFFLNMMRNKVDNRYNWSY